MSKKETKSQNEDYERLAGLLSASLTLVIMSHIVDIALDDAGLPPPTPEIEQERKVAMFDLLEENRFVLPQRDDRVVPDGPYNVQLSIRDKRLVFDVQTTGGHKAAEFHLSLSPFRQVVKDYYQICESYFDAVKTMITCNWTFSCDQL